MNLRPLRAVLWALVAVAILAGAYIVWKGPSAATPPVSVGAPFRLTDSRGAPFDSRQLAGRPYALFFGFTHCPDVCPTTLARLVKLRKALGKGDDSFAIVFVTVDPERDTPAEMAQYLTMFPSPVIGLTGSVAEIERVKSSFGIFSEKVPDGNGGYSVDHSAQVLLFDRDGDFRGTIAGDEGDAPALQKLRNIIEN